MPAVGNITFTDNLSAEYLYPQLSSAQLTAFNADLNKYGSRLYPGARYYQIPGRKIGITEATVANTAVNSVRDSGDWTITSVGNTNPGQPVQFTITGADMSLLTYPSQVARPVGSPTPPNMAYAISRNFDVYTPIDTIIDFGVLAADGVTRTLTSRNSFTEFTVTGFEPSDVMSISDQNTTNDYKTVTARVSAGNKFSKAFIGVPGAAENMTPAEFNSGDRWIGEGSFGGATYGHGNIRVVAGQEIISGMLVRGATPSLPTVMSKWMCDSWDNEVLHLKAKNWPASTLAGGQMVPSEGKAV